MLSNNTIYKNIQLLFLAFSLITLFANNTFSTHVMGVDVFYECTGPNTYLFTVDLYRDCNGVTPGGVTTLNFTSPSGCGAAFNAALTLTNAGGTEVSQVCISQIPQTNCNGGNLPGTEVWTYQGVVTFPNTCTDWTYAWSLCCRNNQITNLTTPGNMNLYMDGLVNTNVCNNSPTYTSMPTPYICQGQQFCYSLGASDSENDSLVFSMVQPLDDPAPGIPITYIAGHTVTEPLTSSTPWTFDPVSGQFCFTPDVVQNGVVKIQIDEYRNGILIGTSSREMQIIVQNCTNQQPDFSSPPISNLTGGSLTDTLTIEVCPGDNVNFNIISTDANGDNITMSSNVSTSIPGATFTSSCVCTPVTGTFDWTPSAADIGVYYLTIDIQDDGCPIMGTQYLTITIEVLDGTTAGPDQYFCASGGQVQLNANGGTLFNWAPSTGLSCTNCSDPFATPPSTTTYIVTSDLSATCKNSDTVTVFVVNDFTLNAGPDVTICLNESSQLNATASPSSEGPFTYEWSPATGLTNPLISNPIASPTASTTYTVTVTSASGCVAQDSLNVIISGLAPAVTATSNRTRVCPGDTTQLHAILSGTGTQDDFDPGTDNSMWSIINNGIANLNCGSMTGNALHFDGIGLREAITNSMDLTACTSIDFCIMIGAGGAPCENADAGEDVDLSYSIDGGITWVLIQKFDEAIFNIWTCLNINIPNPAKTNATLLRWNQPNFSACIGCDNWAIDDVQIACTVGGPYSYSWTPSAGLNNPNIADPIATVDNTTTYVVNVTDLNNPSCAGSGLVTVQIDTSVSVTATIDTTLCIGSPANIQLNANVNGTPPSSSLICGGLNTPCINPPHTENVGYGLGNTGLGTPYEGWYSDGRVQYLYTASDLLVAGMVSGTISEIGFNIANKRSTTPYNGFTIKMKCTPLSCLGTNWETGLTTVYGPIAYTTNPGWNTHTLLNTFDWDGTSNILVEICFDNNTWTNDDFVFFTNTMCTSALYAFADGSTGCTLNPPTVSRNLPNAQFTICDAPPGGFMYSWTPATGLSDANSQNPTASVSSSTQYVVTVSGGTCTVTDTATIDFINCTCLPPIPTANITDVDCFGSITGNIDITVTGGTTPYTYNWSNGSTTQDISGLSTGIYTLTLTDNINCDTILSYTVSEPSNLSATLTPTDANCNSGCDGSIDVSVVGGNSPYTYTWSNSTNSQNVSSLCAGNYTVTVTDINGCSSTFSSTVNEPDPISLSITGTNVGCNGGTDGTASVSPTGGTPSGTLVEQFTMTFGSAFSYTTTNTNAPGNYYVIVSGTFSGAGTCERRDGAFWYYQSCNNITPISSFPWKWNGSNPNTQSQVPSTYNSNHIYYFYFAGGSSQTFSFQEQNSSWYSDNSGSLTFEIYYISSAGYTYNWSPTPGGGQGTSDVTGLSAGNYTVTVSDANGCSNTANITITEPNALIASIASIDETCNGNCDGSTDLSISGGTTPYTFNWSNSSNSEDLSGLCPNSYSVTVTDGNGCTVVETTNINAGANPIANFTYNGNQCLAGNNYVFTNTGTSGINYSWDFGDGMGISTFENPSYSYSNPGSYTVTLTVSDGICTDITTLALVVYTDPTGTISGNDESCLNSCDGSADLTITLGSANIANYSWSNGSTTQDISGLCAGSYNVTFTDMNGCSNTSNVTIGSGSGVNAGFSVNDKDQCLNGNQFDFINLGTPQILGSPLFSWDFGDGSGTSTLEEPSYSYSSAGAYPVTLIVDNGICSDTVTDIIFVFEGPVVSLSGTDVLCNGNCDGTATVSIISGNSPYSFQWDNGQSTSTATGLCTGTYNVTITDDKGCVTIDNYTISEPSSLSLSLTSSDLSCNGVCTGSASSVVSGGSSPYTYTWSSGQSTATISSLCAGTYNLTVTDLNGCTNTAGVSVNEPAILTSSTSSNPTSCNGLCDGDATISGSGGTAPYSYQWDDPGFQTTVLASGLCIGNYNVTVTDANGCTHINSISVSEPTAITLSTSSTDAICGVANGSASVIPSGGTPSYTYSWNSGQSTSTASGLIAGSYTITVTDNNGCSSTTNVSVNDAGAPSASITDSIMILCNGGNNGSATVTATGGSPSYTYLWNDGQTSSIASGLSAGSYTVDVTDNLGCVASASITITEPTQLNASVISTINTSCNLSCDATATAAGAGGTGTYTFSWGTTPIQSGTTATGLCAGTYNLTITDQNGCTGTTNTVISEPSPLTLTITPTGALCNGGSSGSADLEVIGGTPSYTYIWSNSSSTQDISNLQSGSYTVTLTDANNCTETQTVSISEPNAITVATTHNDANCNQPDGSATANGSGGTGSYTYNWSTTPIQTNSTATGLLSGSYSVTIIDANGCTGQGSANISDIPGGNASANLVSNASGFGLCDGQAQASMSGGTAPYTYLWNDPSNQTNSNAIGLCAGTYCVTITDINGCSDTSCIVINQPNAISLTLTPTNILCHGDCDGSINLSVTGGVLPYTYVWAPGGLTAQNISNQCAGTYSVTVTDSNGISVSSSTTITEPLSSLSATISSINATCNGGSNGSLDLTVSGGTAPYTYNWSPGGATSEDIANLIAGNYTVLITDNNGCTETINETITEPTLLTLTTSSNDANCGQPDGNATVFPSGGTGTFTYLWNTTPSQTTATANAISSGSYNVTITDGNGCTSSTSVTINDVGGGTASINNSTDALCLGSCDGTATAGMTGGTSPFSYQWNDPGNQISQTASGLCQGTYTVTVTDNVGCSSTATITINEPTSIASSISGNDAICLGSCDGDATVSGSGGTSPYSYTWNDPGSQTTGTAINLCAGNYTVTITDINGCFTTNSITLNEPGPLVVSTTYTPSHCGQADGTASASTISGIAPYSYLWNDLGNQTNSTATGLLASGYSVTITDGNGCTGIGTVAVSDTTGPTSTISSVISTLCPGSSDGEITVAVIDGVPPYTYLWNDGNAQTTTTATGLSAGTYSIIITDVNGCTTTSSGTITEPPAIVVAIPTFNNVSCNGVCDGNATATGSGGTSPYSYLWSDGQNTAIAAGLCAGNYSVTLTDNNGCQEITSITLTEPVTLTTSVLVTDASCSGICDASATVIPSGGTTPYIYTWNSIPIQTNTTATGLCAGTYSIQVTDNNGCVSTSPAIINEPLALTSTIINQVGVDCNGDCDGYAEVSASNGTSPYTYLWDNGETTALITGLCAGSYTVTITDNNGCTHTNIATITEPTSLTNTFTISDVDCFGNATGTATSQPSGGTAPYSYQWNDLNLQTSNIATGLIAGTYTVIITDINGCTLTENTTVNEPVEIVLLVDTNGSNCGLPDGSACVTLSSGFAPFTYSWNTNPIQSNSCATGLLAGTYNIIVTDATGCTATELATINDLGSPTLSIASSGDASCNSGCDGFATVLISHGLAPFTYSWNDPNTQSTALANGLCAGTYTVNIIDSNNCTGSISATIGEPTLLQGSIASQNDANCFGSCDGDATGISSGGTSPYTYQWNTSPIQTNTTATGLCAGNYGLTFIDAQGCTDTTSVTIGQPLVISLTTSVIDANCGQSDGSASVVASGGNGLYGYLWDDGQNSSTATNLIAGTYNIVVTDILGCTGNTSVTVTDIPAGVPTIANTIDVSCNGGNDGSLSVSMAGGTLPFTYIWSNGQTSFTATNLSAGNYSVTITDSNGCIVTSNAQINEPVTLNQSTSSTDTKCYGSCDGTATVIPNGGTSPYTYLWNDPLAQTTTTASGLCAGSYTISITDNNGCISTANQIVVEPSQLALSETHSDANCGQADGMANVTVTGGILPYTFQWSNGSSSAFLVNVLAGTYLTTVTDANNCSSNLAITLLDLAGPTATIISSDSVSCNGGSNGTATVSVSGGTLPYTYKWSDPFSQFLPTASNLTSGIYTVLITDSNNCVASTSITIYEPNPLLSNVSFTNPTCYSYCDGQINVTVTGGTTPYTYLWNDPGMQTTASATGLCDGSFIVAITDNNGCTSTNNGSIQEPIPMNASVQSVSVNCFDDCNGSATATSITGIQPHTYLWSDPSGQITQTASNLCQGQYNVTVSDNTGCFTIANTTVGSPTEVIASIASIGNISCYGLCDGYVLGNANGGTPPYSYSWNTGDNSIQITNLCPGQYSITVTDYNGCTGYIDTSITEPQQLSTSLTNTEVTCQFDCNATATASTSGGTSPYTYQWNDIALQTTMLAHDLCEGSYSVTITDFNGCFVSSSITIANPQQLGLTANTTPAACGQSNGSACVSVIGGAAPFVITWNDPLTTVGACIFNINAGVYNPVVSDSNGCYFSMPVVINNFNGPSIDTIITTDVTCASDSDGTATVTTTTSAGPLSYSWQENGITIDSSSNSLTNMWGGVFSLIVTDTNGCITGDTFSIDDPPELVSSILSFDDITCIGICDGNANVGTGGGTAPYTFSWSNGATSTSVNNLCSGLNTVTITDVQGCETTSSLNISEPNPISVADSVFNVGCNGENTGSATIFVSGGTPYYVYNWSPSGLGTAPLITNLAAQSYTATIEDMNGCITTHTLTISEPTPIGGSGAGYPSTCGNYNGIATINPFGGTPPYTYLWDDPLSSTNDTVTNLLARDPYYVIVSDFNGCSDTFSIAVGDIPGPVIDSITTIDILCYGQTSGQGDVYISGGTEPFNYQWNDPSSQTTTTATGLNVGTYLISITDDNGCTVSQFISITEPSPLQMITSTDTTICIGQLTNLYAVGNGGTMPYLYVWNNSLDSIPSHLISPNTTTIYEVFLIDANGCHSDSGIISINVNPPLTATTIGDDACIGEDIILSVIATGGDGGPYNYSWSNGYTSTSLTLTGLTNDTSLTIIVSDGCSPDTTVSVTGTLNPVPNISILSNGYGCEPSVIATFTAISDTTPLISWSWNFGDGSTSSSAGTASHEYSIPGSYDVTLTVVSDKGCYHSITQLNAITVSSQPTADFLITQNGSILNPPEVSILNPTFDFINTSSVTDSAYWNFGDPESDTNNISYEINPSHTFNNTQSYTVWLVVISDDGCIDSIAYDLSLYGEYIVFTPNAFSPNGDGDNDYFFPVGYGVQGDDYEMTIYNRWGDKIAYINGKITHNNESGWDGTANGGSEASHMDVYVWKMKTTDLFGIEHEYMGHVTIIK